VATKTYKRAAEFVEGIGDNLDTLQGRDVLLVSFEVGERAMRGEKKPFVAMSIAELDDAENPTLYHAWSESLAIKLHDIPQDELPLLVNFKRVSTTGGFRVWTFE
jgi:O-succinylbenzoate synthase